MGTLFHETRLAIRKLLRDPFLSGVSVIALMLGIGLSASMYSIAYSVLVRGMPFQDPDELVGATQTFVESGGTSDLVSFQDYRDMEEEQTTFSELGAWISSSRELVDGGGRADRARVTLLSPSMLPLLGESPALGRGFSAEDIGPDVRVALMSDGLWRDRYGSDPEVLGRTLRLDGEGFTVIGVMPPGFAFPDDEDFWLPLPFDAENAPRGRVFVRVVGRLPGDTPEALAETELAAITGRLARTYPETNQPARINLVPLVHTFIGREEMELLWTLVIASFFVLLIACANVANLLAARALDRSGDVAVGAALGAGKGRIVGGLVLEALVLALAGGALGVVLANFGVDWFDGAMGPRKPVWMTFAVDGPILLFILVVSVLSALLAGLAPALRSASVSVREVLQDESRGASSRQLGRLSQGMVVLTIALAYPLLVGAGLLIATFQETSRVVVSEREQLLAVQLSLSSRRYPGPEEQRVFWDDLLSWARGRPGVDAATWADWVPPGYAGRDPIQLEGVQYLRREDHPRVRVARVRPGFFSVLEVAPTRGRPFDDGDRSGPPVVIVNEPLAQRFFAGQDPLGRRLRIGYGEDGPWRTVVGVVPDLRMNGSSQSSPEGLFLPAPPVDPGSGHLLLRSTGDPSLLLPDIRDRIATMDPELPVRRVETLNERAERTFWFVTLIGSIFSTFGIAALFLASVGLYGVVAHSVSRRTRETGIRMALGATNGSIIRLFLWSGLKQVGVGMAIGALLAFWGSRLLATVLFGVRAGDPATMVVVAGVLVTSAAVAILLPSLRATRSSSVDALRGE